MSRVAAVTVPVATSASSAEKDATSPAGTEAPSSVPTRVSKLRSCLICRNRKVRCDKQSPCSNCRRANIACVLPPTDRPPRWARRLERLNSNAAGSRIAAPQDVDPGVNKVMDRLRNLEDLVKELRGQLEQAHAAASSASEGPSGVNSPGSSTQSHDPEHQREPSRATSASNVQRQFGRLVLQDANRSRYVSSGFWSRIDDEASLPIIHPPFKLEGLKIDTRSLPGDGSTSSEDEASPKETLSIPEVERTPSERHAFLFRHNLSPSAPKLGEFHPLPSLVPFLLDVFSENVNIFVRIVHLPTITQMVRDLRSSGVTLLTPSNEALMFSIYYAAIASMEGDDIMTNFGSSKANLTLKYRLGLEHALAKADFLNAPDLILVQAFALFLVLARRHESPRFVWMMTGLVIRMSQYLGLQRDGAHFEHMSPFEIEMRRKVWWLVCMLDLRASEDQGTDLTIASGSYDTKIPLNINDTDIDLESTRMPTERFGVTDMSFARIFAGITEVMRHMMARDVDEGVAGVEDQSLLLSEIYRKFEEGYLQYTTESGNIAYWVSVTVARLTMAKMTLIVFLPVLFSSPNEQISDEIRSKLLVSAIEVAEYNHALNAEQACRQWRWIYQTYTHWHAIVYLMIEISRRPWSPIIERAWVALHSRWLIPARTTKDNNLRNWVPLRKLMNKAHAHRDAELARLRADPQAAAKLETEDQKIQLPSSSGPLSTGSSVNVYRNRWRQLVTMLSGPGDVTQISEIPDEGLPNASMHMAHKSHPPTKLNPGHSPGDSGFDTPYKPTYLDTNEHKVGQIQGSYGFSGTKPANATDAPADLGLEQTIGSLYDSVSTFPSDWSDGRNMGPGFVPWLWADATTPVDVFSNLDLDSMYADMDLEGEVNWYNWVESAKGMEWMQG